MRKKCRGAAALCLLVLLAAAGVFWYRRGHWKVETAPVKFTESARELSNPNRGFYYIYGFYITDESVDYQKVVEERFREDTGTRLAMIQVNLQTYRDGEISKQGLFNIQALFDALRGLDKQFLVRFLYDWDGENKLYEPQSLAVILGHMRQLEDIMRKNSDRIFVLQGLFTGNWGEMNGTRYSDAGSMQALAAQLAAVTDDATYLAVRTPAQWRQITETADAQELPDEWRRLGLFNDGILGNESDYGTYGTEQAAVAGAFSYWNRQEELAFQEELCRYVPNGGEVIHENPLNDFENACRAMAEMHVTYINRDYDREVLDKWAATTVETQGCFDGMDGLTYIERHLGYRLLIAEADMRHDFWENRIFCDITMQNAGFAPLYKECEAEVIVRNETTGEERSFPVEQKLSQLSGGMESEKRQTLTVELPLADLEEGTYALYFKLSDVATGEMILLANEQEADGPGYHLGIFCLK